MIVKQILAMKAGPEEIVTVRPDSTVGEAARLLSERRIGAVVVSSDGRKAEGILSERDIVRELGRSGPDVLDRKASELMTSKVMTCVCGDDALELLDRMTKGRFRHLPVLDDKGEMLGVVSIGDVVFGRLKELNAEKEALTGMIMGN
ncbi:CBS domain-containing protein [Paracoccus sp. MC1862]|uniref:CBS domain-containing protein n=1 Tax=Paracoccus sp. MC1862 TaxID=2760307 RepID=UPI001603DE9D|nr:CBS domain-containing protein [Paracoccus sp. MC1862]MBB1497316.1 CBS domain-containing protein [Paracoccus sp. MC1862]QQO44719.1 CBS domain-containing protein [Paracoccus sp. MC1862]